MLGGEIMLKKLLLFMGKKGGSLSMYDFIIASLAIEAMFNNTGKKGYEVLKKLLGHEDNRIRELAIEGIGFALRESGNQEVVDVLQRILIPKHVDKYVHMAAAEAMGLILRGRDDAIECFKPHLEIENGELRSNILRGLSLAYQGSCDKDILDTLKRQIKVGRKLDAWELVVIWAIIGIGLVCRGVGDYTLLRIIKPYLKFRYEVFRAAAAYASALIFEGTGNEYILDLIKPLFYDFTEVRTAAAISTYILFKNYGEEAVRKLSPLTRHRNWAAYVATAFGLGSALRGTGNEEATNIVKKFLKSSSDDARALTGLALADLYNKLGDKVYDELLEMIEKGNEDEAGWAIYTMGSAYEATKREDILETLTRLYNPGWFWAYGYRDDAIRLAIGKLFRGSKDQSVLERGLRLSPEALLKNPWFFKEHAIVLAMANILAESMPQEYWRAILYRTRQFGEKFWGMHLPIFY